MSHGEFSIDNPQAEWAVGERPEDRNMRTLREFWFVDSHKRKWLAPSGTSTDGASIPRFLWSLVGSPFTGNYRRAAIVHDVACVDAGHDSAKRRAADRMFYDACRAGGCSIKESILLYLGVRFGAWIGLVPAWVDSRAPRVTGARLELTAPEAHALRDFQVIAEMVLRAGETDDIEAIELRADEAASQVTGVNVRGQ